MLPGSLHAIFHQLNVAGIRYLVAGGLAVNAHGHVRVTKDLDIVLALEPRNLAAALDVFAGLGYRPKVPVALAEFADASKRESWIRDKRMTVFQLFSDRHETVPIDLFAEIDFDFDAEEARCLQFPFASNLRIPVVSLELLTRMKRTAGRPKDLLDLEELGRGVVEEPR